MTTNTSWVNAMRAETLAKLYLTRRPDIEVFTISASNSRAGYDLLVRVNGAGTTDTPEFGVEAKGISQPLDSSGWRSRVLRDVVQVEDRAAVPTQDSDLPICLFVFNIDTEDGLYMWLREPIVDRHSQPGTLVSANPSRASSNRNARTSGNAPFEKLDKAALDRIVERVIQWYRTRDTLLLPNGSTDKTMNSWS